MATKGTVKKAMTVSPDIADNPVVAAKMTEMDQKGAVSFSSADFADFAKGKETDKPKEDLMSVDSKIPVNMGENEDKLDKLILLVKEVLIKEKHMSIELDNLTAEVTEVNTVQQSAITLLEGLSAQIAAIKTDPIALQALADSLDSSSKALAAAIVANTPA